MRLRSALAAAVAWGAMAGTGAALDPDRELTQYIHDAWTVKDGLGHGTVTQVLQDEQGYVWVATREGLLRFDGQRFTPVSLEPAGSPTPPEVKILYRGRDAVWLGTSDPPALYRLDGAAPAGSWPLPIPADGGVRALHQDAAGLLWVGTTHGLFGWRDGRFVDETRRLRLPVPSVRVLLEDRGGNLWVGTAAGLARVRDGAGAGGPTDVFDCGDVRALLQDRTGALWVGTFGNGLVKLQDGVLTRYDEKDRLLHPTVYALAEDRDGNVWIGTHRGMIRVRGRRFVSLPAPAGLEKSHVLDFELGAEGSLWVATEERGLHRLRDGAVVTYGKGEGFPSERIMAVRSDAKGALWLGTDAGVVHWTGARMTVYPIEDAEGEHRAKSLFLDADGTLWAGTYGRLFRLAPGARSLTPVDVQGRLGRRTPVETILRGPDGLLWVATGGAGILRLDGGALKGAYTREDGLPSNALYALYPSRDGTVWAATGAGLARFAGGRWIPEQAGQFVHGAIVAFYEDSDGVLWAGTERGGLGRYADGRWTHLDRASGLPASAAFSFAEDRIGNLWIMCERGLYRVRRQALAAAAAGRPARETPRLFGETDGIRGLIGYGTRQPGSARTVDGRLWFATPKGLASVCPECLRLNETAPLVLIERVLRDGQAVEARPPATFPAGSANYEFQYTALRVSTPERARFRYRLEGVDPAWVEAGTRRTAYYTQVPPGRYTFRVTACNEDDACSESGAAFAFTQPRHLHQTPWFYATCAAGLLLMGAAIHGFRLRGLAHQQAHLSRLVDERTRRLQEATHHLDLANRTLEETNRHLEQRVAEGIEALREAERMAAYGQMVAAVAHEVRHPIFALQAASYVLQDHLRSREDLRAQLRILDSQTQRLNLLMNDLLDFAKPGRLHVAPAQPRDLLEEAIHVFRSEGHPDVAIALEPDPGLPAFPVDRFRVVQALVNLMRNSLQHAAGASRLILMARQGPPGDGPCVRLSVIDDGAGIPAEALSRVFDPFFTTAGQGTGLGLAIVRQIVTAHRGQASVESMPGRGSAFHLDFPAGEAAPGARVTVPGDVSCAE